MPNLYGGRDETRPLCTGGEGEAAPPAVPRLPLPPRAPFEPLSPAGAAAPPATARPGLARAPRPLSARGGGGCGGSSSGRAPAEAVLSARRPGSARPSSAREGAPGAPRGGGAAAGAGAGAAALLAGRRAAEALRRELPLRGFADVAEAFSYMDEFRRRKVRVVDMKRGLERLRVGGVDARSLFVLASGRPLPVDRPDSAEMSEHAFAKLFGWAGQVDPPPPSVTLQAALQVTFYALE
jgi:hypothetical protein